MKLDITLKQYELIFRIVSSVAEQFSHGAGRSCQFYNTNAAFILNKALKIHARPVMGVAFIRLNEEGDTAVYAGEESGSFYSSPEYFHCWVETPNFLIDFTSPEYSKSEGNFLGAVPRNMFQRPKAKMSYGPSSLTESGDFFFEENRELTEYFIKKMTSIPATSDFANICLEWHKKCKKKVLKEMEIMNDHREVTHIQLKQGGISSAW